MQKRILAACGVLWGLQVVACLVTAGVLMAKHGMDSLVPHWWAWWACLGLGLPVALVYLVASVSLLVRGVWYVGTGR